MSNENLATKIHDLINALSIARGMCETVQMGLTGEVSMSSDQIKDKNQKALRALDKAEVISQKIRQDAKSTQ
jgi:hypothetical protein